MRTPKLAIRIALLLGVFMVWLAGSLVLVFVKDYRWTTGPVAATLMAALFAAYWLLSRNVLTQPGSTAYAGPPPDLTRIKANVDVLAASGIDVEQAAFFVQMLMGPAEFVPRISERITPATRSYLVETSFSIRVPKELKDKAAIVPIFLARKGLLLDSFKVSQADKRYSTLSQDVAVAHTTAAIRVIVAATAAAHLTYFVREVEPDLIRFLARSDEVEDDDGDFVDLVSKLHAIPFPSVTVRGLLTAVLSGLATHYPIVIVEPKLDFGLESGSHNGSAPLRLIVERRAIPTVNDRQGFADRAMGFVRAALGISSARIIWPITNSLRTRSFHLETSGPAGSYLARQGIIDEKTGEPTNPIASQVQPLSRMGQRYGHLYIHGRNENPKRDLVYVAVFYERPPGSVAPATLSAFAALVLVVIAAFTRLTTRVDVPSDLVAVLLAVPVVASAWSGFERAASVYVGTLSARASQVTTMVVSLGAAAYYLLGDFPETKKQFAMPVLERPGAHAWTLLISAAAYCFLLSAASWVLRASVYKSFVRNPVQTV